MSLAILTKFSAALGRALLGASRDLAPIITIIALFQVLVLHQPFPELFSILTGLGLVIVGLALFVVAGLIENTSASIDRYALGVRLTVALSVGAAIVLGVLRILRGWSLPVLIIGGYVLVMVMTLFAPKEIVGLAYDSGGVTTSTVTVPLVTALSVGLARTIRGRDPLTDGFGLIALASLTPMIFVMLFGTIVN